MGIVDALKTSHNLRLSTGTRWLVWDNTYEQWVVYGREPYQKRTRTHIITPIEDEAVDVLLEEE